MKNLINASVVREQIAALVSEKLGSNYSVSVQEVNKVHDHYYALNISKPEQKVIPALRIDEFVSRYLMSSGIALEEIASEIVNAYLEAMRNTEFLEAKLDGILTKENILSNVRLELASNEHIKGSGAFVGAKFLDLNVVYRVQISEDETGVQSLIVKDELLKSLGISTTELNDAARINTLTKPGFSVRNMNEVMSEIMGIPLEFLDNDPSLPQIYVMTNHNGIYGASIMLFEDYFERLSKRFDADLVILPSSVHEVLALPLRDTDDIGELTSMVREINANEVSAQDKLSDNVYLYERATKRIRLADMRS